MNTIVQYRIITLHRATTLMVCNVFSDRACWYTFTIIVYLQEHGQISEKEICI